MPRDKYDSDRLQSSSRLKRDRSSSRERRYERSPKRNGRSRSRERHRERSPKRNDRSKSKERPAQDMNTGGIHAALSGAEKKGGKRRNDEPSSGRNVWGNVGAEEEYEAEKRKARGEDVPEEEKQKANFGLTGALAKDENTGNMYNGVLLKWTEPLDAAGPPKGWRFYVFKDDKVVETLYLHRQSAFLFGRDNRVADHVLGHPSCSGQHAVIQFRAVRKRNADEIAAGNKEKRVSKPYIMDLGSTNKTYLNGEAIEDSRYYELLEKDVVKFGNSTREYVLICDKNS